MPTVARGTGWEEYFPLLPNRKYESTKYDVHQFKAPARYFCCVLTEQRQEGTVS
jgi:hypothetical protein